MEFLKQLITSVYPLPEGSVQRMIQATSVTEYEKLSHPAKAAQKNNQEYLLLDGFLHRYSINLSGEPVTTAFYMGPVVITPHFARTVNGRNRFSIQALTPVTLAAIPVSILDKLRSEHDDIRDWGNRVVENELNRMLHQEVISRTLSAGERLLLLRKDYPGIENRIPHHFIASFLGITPVSFSRLRKELSRS